MADVNKNVNISLSLDGNYKTQVASLSTAFKDLNTKVIQPLSTSLSGLKVPSLNSLATGLDKLQKSSDLKIDGLDQLATSLKTIQGLEIPKLSSLATGIKKISDVKGDIPTTASSIAILAKNLKALDGIDIPSITTIANGLTKMSTVVIPSSTYNSVAKLGTALKKFEGNNLSNLVAFETINKQLKELTANSKSTQSAVNSLQTSFKSNGGEADRLAKKLGTVSGKLSEYFQYRAVADTMYYFKQAVSEAVLSIIDYDQALKDIQAITLSTEEDVQKMGIAIKNVADSTKFSAVEVAEGVKVLGQAGLSAQEATSTIGAVANLATGTLTSMENAVDLVTTAMRVYNIEAERSNYIADVFANAVNNSKLTIDKLRTALNYVGPVSESAGVSIAETSASMQTLANAGLKASTIGTGLRRVFAELVDPSAKLQKAAESVGVSLSELDLTTNTLSDVYRSLGVVVQDTQTAFELFGKRGASAALTLTKDVSGGFDTLLNSTERFGTASEQADIQMEGLGVSFKNLGDKLRLLATAVGDAGLNDILRIFVDVARDTTDALRWLIEETNILQGIFAGALIASLAKLSISFSASIATITAQTVSVTSLTAAWRLLSVAMASNPIGALAVGVGIAVSAYLTLNETLEETSQKLREQRAELEGVDSALGQLKSQLSNIEFESASDIDEFIKRMLETFPQWTSDILEAQASIESTGDAVKVLTTLVDKLQTTTKNDLEIVDVNSFDTQAELLFKTYSELQNVQDALSKRQELGLDITDEAKKVADLKSEYNTLVNTITTSIRNVDGIDLSNLVSVGDSAELSPQEFLQKTGLRISEVPEELRKQLSAAYTGIDTVVGEVGERIRQQLDAEGKLNALRMQETFGQAFKFSGLFDTVFSDLSGIESGLSTFSESINDDLSELLPKNVDTSNLSSFIADMQDFSARVAKAMEIKDPAQLLKAQIALQEEATSLYDQYSEEFIIARSLATSKQYEEELKVIEAEGKANNKAEETILQERVTALKKAQKTIQNIPSTVVDSADLLKNTEETITKLKAQAETLRLDIDLAVLQGSKSQQDADIEKLNIDKGLTDSITALWKDAYDKISSYGAESEEAIKAQNNLLQSQIKSAQIDLDTDNVRTQLSSIEQEYISSDASIEKEKEQHYTTLEALEQQYVDKVSTIQQNYISEINGIEQERVSVSKSIASSRLSIETQTEDALRDIRLREASDSEIEASAKSVANEKIAKGLELVRLAAKTSNEEQLASGRELIQQAFSLGQGLDSQKDALKVVALAGEALQEALTSEESIRKTKLQKEAQEALKKKIDETTDAQNEYNSGVDSENTRHSTAITNITTERDTKLLALGEIYSTESENEAKRHKTKVDNLQTELALAKQIASASSSSSSSGGQVVSYNRNGGLITPEYFANGGGVGNIFKKLSSRYITNGSGTKDDVPAMLTKNEFVHRPEAVKKYGVGFMNMINSLQLPSFFADGGLTGSLSALSSAGSGLSSYSASTTSSSGMGGYQTVKLDLGNNEPNVEMRMTKQNVQEFYRQVDRMSKYRSGN